MKKIASILAVFGMLFTSFACSPAQPTGVSSLNAEDTFYDYSLSFDSLLDSAYFENPTILKPVMDAAKENIDRFRDASEWFVSDTNIRMVKINNSGLSLGSGDLKIERHDTTDLSPALRGDKDGNSKGWPNDPRDSAGTESASDAAWRNQLDYAVKSTTDFLRQSQEDYDRDRAREAKARDDERAARAKQTDLDTAKLNADWQAKFQQDRDQLVSSIQADIARSNQEAANAALVLAMIRAPIDTSETLAKNLTASKAQAEANLNAQLANDEMDLTKQKRQEALAELENAARASESIASAVAASSRSDVTPTIKRDGFKTPLRSIEGVSVRDAAVYVGIAKSRVEAAPAGENRDAAQKIIGQSQEVLKTSDEALASGDLETGNGGLDLTYALADAAVALAPLALVIFAPAALPAIAVATGISFAKDYYELCTGKNLFSGKELNKLERGFAAFGVITVIPLLKAGKAVGTLATTAEEAARILTAVNKEAEVAEATAAALKASEVALDAAVRAGVNAEQTAAAFSKATKSLRAAGYEDDVVKAVTTISHWSVKGGTSSIVHVLLGDFHKEFLTGGMHTFQGLKKLFSLNPAAEAAIKVEVASNGVGRVMVHKNFLSTAAAGGAESVVKTLFPESWTAQKIVDAVDSIASKTFMKTGRYINEAVVDGVNIRVVFEDGTIRSAFPIFPP